MGALLQWYNHVDAKKDLTCVNTFLPFCLRACAAVLVHV